MLTIATSRLSLKILVALSVACAAADLKTFPPELRAQFDRARVSESGDFTVNGKSADELVTFITSNWDALLKDAGTIADPDELNRVASKIGAVAEDLPPLEYLDFLGAYMDLYEARRFPDVTLSLQLGGRGRKDSFLSVNYEHPQVKILLERAKQLLPKDDEELQSLLDDMATGKLADNYRTEVSDHVPPPETLPGIKLKKPWASILDKVKPREHSPADREDGARKESGNGSVPTPSSRSEVEPAKPPGRGILAGAILLLVGAIYVFFSRKARATRKKRS